MEAELLKLSPALIVEDDPAMQRRLTQVLTSVDPGADVTLASSLADAHAVLSRKEFALVLAEIGLPDGDACELIARLHRHRGNLPVLVVSSRGHVDTVLAALRAGASGYLLKERDDIELALSLRSIQRGGAPIDPMVARHILALLPDPVDQAQVPAEEVRLSAREHEVLQLLARGCTNREIANLTLLSRLTIDGYTKAIYRKLAVGSRAAAVFEAQKLGLLQ